MYRIRPALGAVAAAALLGLAGCGETSTEEEVREVAAEYLEALADADPEICELSSEAEQARIELVAAAESGEEAPSCETAIRDLYAELGDEGPSDAEELRELAHEVEEAEVEAEERNAIIILGEGPLEHFVSLVKEKGKWHVDDFQ